MAPCLSRYARKQEEEFEDIATLGLLYYYLKRTRKRQHRWWVHEILQQRKKFGVYHHLVKELELDSERFHQYFRLTREQLQQVLFHIGPHMTKINLTREAIGPKERLSLCIRFLATGESFKSLSFSFRIGVSTVSGIIAEVCELIWKHMHNIYMPMPRNSDDWTLIAENFNVKWNFPSCIGSLDGKHVVLKAPDKTGSLYYNYKNTFSMVLLALVDANLKFTYVDIGSYGRNSDGGIFSHSSLGKALSANNLNLPPDAPLPGAQHLGSVPYIIIGDEAFPLQKNLLRPFPGKDCTQQQKLFNYRLSRARRIVENAFGILACRWRVYHTKIAVKPETVKSVVKEHVFCTICYKTTVPQLRFTLSKSSMMKMRNVKVLQICHELDIDQVWKQSKSDRFSWNTFRLLINCHGKANTFNNSRGHFTA